MITLARLKEAVDALEARAADKDDDPESWHGTEDNLMVEVLRAIADGAPDPHLLAAEMLRTDDMDATRWYA